MQISTLFLLIYGRFVLKRSTIVGSFFVPGTSINLSTTARMTATADVAHCHGLSPQSYGTMLQAAVYDTNSHICPLVFAHSVRTECEETQLPELQALQSLPSFDVARRTTIVDQENSIGAAFRSRMGHANMFLDWIHIKKNMSSSIGTEKTIGVSLYERVLRASSEEIVSQLKLQYGPNQCNYLEAFNDSQLYICCSNLEYTVYSS